MDIQDLITGIRWELLKEIANAPTSGAELARILNTTPANVSQHLKLLELGGLVRKERVGGKAVQYRLTQHMALVTLLDATASRAVVPLDPVALAQMRLLMTPGNATRSLRLFLCQHEELARTFTAFGTLPSANPAETHLLVIAEDTKPLRKEYANLHLAGTTIVIWSHTAAEFAEGLARHDPYFTDKLAAVRTLADPDGLFSLWRPGSRSDHHADTRPARASTHGTDDTPTHATAHPSHRPAGRKPLGKSSRGEVYG